MQIVWNIYIVLYFTNWFFISFLHDFPSWN